MSSRYEFLDGLKYAYPVVAMCAWLGVSKSGYYEWRGRPASATAQRREALTELITEVFEESGQTYGHRRVQAQLARGNVHVGAESARSWSAP